MCVGVLRNLKIVAFSPLPLLCSSHLFAAAPVISFGAPDPFGGDPDGCRNFSAFRKEKHFPLFLRVLQPGVGASSVSPAPLSGKCAAAAWQAWYSIHRKRTWLVGDPPSDILGANSHVS